jgi:hypothetical protein
MDIFVDSPDPGRVHWGEEGHSSETTNSTEMSGGKLYFALSQLAMDYGCTRRPQPPSTIARSIDLKTKVHYVVNHCLHRGVKLVA